MEGLVISACFSSKRFVLESDLLRKNYLPTRFEFQLCIVCLLDQEKCHALVSPCNNIAETFRDRFRWLYSGKHSCSSQTPVPDYQKLGLAVFLS